MSLKDLFESTKVTKSGSADETSYEVESEAYTEAFAVEKNEFVPPVDFSTASNFARYGSAAKYYEDSIQRIYNDYPYDGSKYEVMAFHNSSSYLDRWILEYKYPRTTGYVHLGTTSGSGDWLTMVSSSAESVGGWGMPDTTSNNILEYIEIKGGPNTGSADRTFETQDVSLKKLFNFSNVYDSGSAREYNLEYDLRTGMTVEFWMLKNSFYTSKTEREVVFDLWNNENSSSAGYGRLMIELSGTGVTNESVIRLTAQSGTTGFVNKGIATITTSDVADGVWKHYAITLKNAADDSGVNAKLYVNGQVSGSSNLGSAGLGRVTGSMLATIGALVAPPSGATGYYDTTNIAKGGAKLSASIDEFRFWKLERDPRQIGRNWFTQVGGGSNTDDANVGLGVYYKFNEGIANSGSRDRTVLDYSGRISNGFWKNGLAETRNSGSAMASGSHNMNEHHDPIIYSEHPDVQDLETAMIVSGTHHDNLNNSLITSNFPDWTVDDNRDSTLKHFTQIIASYFDKLHMQIEAISTIKERYGSSYATGDVSASFKPVPFAKNLVSQFGIAVPEILQDAELIENFLSRNEVEEYEEKLHNIRNQIYSNIYANLLYVFKTKGTEKSMRNMLRCFGIDDELVKINTYADNSDYVFKDNRRATTNKTNYVDFNHSDRNEGTVYQAVSMSVDGVYSNPNARAYITGSSNFGEFNAQTVECEVFFPLKTTDMTSPHWYQDSFTTASLFGAMGTVESQTDTRFPTSDPVDLKVYALKDELESTRARFRVSSSVLGTLTSDYYEDVYDDTRWNFAVRVKPSKHPWVEHISGTISAGDPMGAQTFDVEFYGVNVFTDVKQHEFLKTTTVTEAIGKSFLSSSKRCYVGALHQDFTGSILNKSNVLVGNLRYWMSDVSDEVVLTHAMDQSSHGTESPYKNVFIYQNSMSGTYVPQIATLALHWNFDNVTGSGNSPSDPLNTKDAQFIVQDISSGSAEHGERYEPAFSDQVMMQHIGIGDFFLDNKTNVVNTRYVPTAKLVLPEYLHSSDMVEIRQRDDEFFTMESRPSKVIYSIEKSMYQTISEEMIKMFATIKDFDNLIGEPVNRYRPQYKDMAKLRQLFFEKMPNTPDLDKYVDYYKWIDSAVSRFIEDLFPASAMHSEGMQNMVESHMLERSKYETKYPSMEFEGDPPIGSAEGINKLLYDYQRGHAPVPLAPGGAEMMDQDQNCLWWSKRADREHPILASTALSASSPGMNLSGTLTSRAGIFSASTSAFNRKLHTPYKYSVEESRLIHGGINFDNNKKLGYVYPATVPFSPKPLEYGTYGGYPLGYLVAKDMDVDASPSASLPNCDVPLSSSYGAKVKREGYKVIDGWQSYISAHGGNPSASHLGWTSSSYTTFRGNLVMPFNVISSSQHDVNSGYTAMINQDLTVFKGSGVGHSTDAGTYINKIRQPHGTYDTPSGDSDDGSSHTTPTKVGGLGRGVNLVNLHTDTYGDDKETPMQGPFTEKYVGGRAYRHAPINDGTDTLNTRQEGWLVLISTALSTSSGVLHATSGGVGLVGPDYPYPHGPYPFAVDDVQNWRPIGGRYYRDETAKRPVNIRNIQMVTSSIGVEISDPTTANLDNMDPSQLTGYETIGEHRIDIIGTDGDDISAWTKHYHPQIATGSATTIIGNYRHNYEVVHTVGRSSQKPFLRDNQSVRNIEQTGSFAETPSILRTTSNPDALGAGTGTKVSAPTLLPTTTHVETILTQKFQASSSTVTIDAQTFQHQYPTDASNTVLQGARVIVSAISGGAAGTADEHIYMDHTVQDRGTGSTNLNTIFANRFSAPGGPRNQSKGFLDLAAEEYSVYNAYTFRNLEVLGSSSGEYLSTHAQIHSSSHYPRLGLQSLRRMPSGKFGVENVVGQDTEIQDHSHDYGVTPSWHKIHRNGRLEHRLVTPAQTQHGQKHIEKRVYDNDYVTRPIPQNDYQYAWISASLAPSGANSTYHNLGHDYHMDGFNHPTPSGSRPVDPIIFISASEMGSSHGTAGTHATAEDRPYRYWGIGSNLGGAQFIPNVHRLNLNIVDNQNTWLTDNSGAVALGHFTTGGILAADAPLPIDHGHEHKNPHGGAYASQLANIHNYVNERLQGMPAPQHAFSVMSGSSLSRAGNRANIPAVSLKYLDQLGVYYHEQMLGGIAAPMRDWMFVQGSMIGRDEAPSQDLISEPIRFELLPQYWTGSGKANDGEHSIYAMNQSVASIFNSLMWKRNGPYGYPTWKQVRTGEHILAQTMRKNNRYVVVDPQSDRVVYPTPGTVGRLSFSSRMMGTDAVAAYRRLGHINTAERKHNHYYVPVLDRSAKTLLAALQKGQFQVSMDVGGGEVTTTTAIDPDKMLYANVTHVNNLKNFPISKLNEDVGLRDYKSERTAYNDLREMYTEMLHTDGIDAYTLADLTYRETIFPQAKNTGRSGFRSRANYEVGFWGPDPDSQYISPDNDALKKGYSEGGRRTVFDDPNSSNPNSVWEFYRGSNAPPKRMFLSNDLKPTDFFGDGGSTSYITAEAIRNKVSLSVSASVWPMDGHIAIENLTNDGLSGSAQLRASASAETFNVDPQAAFGMHATASAKTLGAPGILQNQYTWFHNGMNLGYEPNLIADVERAAVIMSDTISTVDYHTASMRAGVARFYQTRAGESINTSERLVELPAAGMAFGPSYSRPHMLVSRNSYCSPSAGKAAYSRRFNFASTTYEADGVNTILSGASYYGKGDGMTPFYHGIDANNCTIPFTSSIASQYLMLGDRVVSQLTRSIGHQVEGLYVSDWKWKAPIQSGKAPFYANYDEWFEELRGKSQDRQVLPEYKISDRMSYFVIDKQGRFTSRDSEWLSIAGNPSSSVGSLTSSADVASVGNAITASFVSDYAVTAKASLLDAIKAENADITEPYELTLTCDAIVKFLPYQGFYPQLRTVDLCKQFVDSYDEHVSFESDLDINDKPSSFVRQDSSGSNYPPQSGVWYGFSPWAPTDNFGELSGVANATATLRFKTGTAPLDDGDYIQLIDGDGMYARIVYDTNGSSTGMSAGTPGTSTVTGNGTSGDPWIVHFLGGDTYGQAYGDAFYFAAAVNKISAGAQFGGAGKAFDITAGDPIQYLWTSFMQPKQYKVTLTQDVAEAAGNTAISTSGVSAAEMVIPAGFTGGSDAGGTAVLTSFFFSDLEQAGYGFEIDEIVDPTSPRVGGSGVLTHTGFETHGRNVAAAKRPFYGPFMAPGILFNTIKSGIAVDYPVLNRKLATTASVDRDGGRNYQILNEYFDQRLPFETLVEPERYLTNVPLVDMEPHPSASINVTASWDGQGDPLYKMMMHNFLAEIPNFFLADQSMQSFVSLPESDGNFGQVEAVVHNGQQIIPEYKMMVKVYKSQVQIPAEVAPSCSNHWQNHRGPVHPIKNTANDGTASGSLALLGQYEPCYYTDVIGMESWGKNLDGGFGLGYVKDDYQTPVGVKYNKISSEYTRPQNNGPETITMYSRPSAFGPPSAGGYAFRPEFEYIFTGSAAPMSMSYAGTGGATNLDNEGMFVEGHVAGSGSVGKVADRVNTTFGMKDGTNGYNAPFTPPYYDGQAWAFITFKPTRTGKHYLDDIWEQSTINFLRYEFNYVSGAYGDMGTYGPQGYAMNVNAMQLDAAVNIKGKTSIKEVTYDATTGQPVAVADSNQTSARNSAWVIQTKFETPILHFGYGLTDNQEALTLSGSDNAVSSVESNGYNHGYAGLCEPIGMWHQYGEIPSASQGIYLEVADVPDRYLRFGTEMTIANPKWLHITGSPDPLAGCTAGIINWIADGDRYLSDGTTLAPADGTGSTGVAASILYGAMDWDGHGAVHSSSWNVDYNPITQDHLVRRNGSNAAGLVGKGYRFSGSFSGSDNAYVVGRDTIEHPDQVADGTLHRGGRQQYMRWRLMSTGSLAGIVADMTHLQIVSADDGTILDTTWGVPITISPTAAPGISGSAPCFERGFYITSDVTGSNIISGSGQGAEFKATDNSSSVHYQHSDHRNYLNRGYPGTSSTRQRLMGIGKLTSSLCSDGQPIPFRNYYTQWQFDVPNNNVDKDTLAAGYNSPLHKNKRGVIPDEPHFSNNISTSSFGDAIGCTLYSHLYDPNSPLYSGIGRTVMIFDSGSNSENGGNGITATGFGHSTMNPNAHILQGTIHEGPTVGRPILANGWNRDAPISNSVGIGRAEIICGYTGSSGRYAGAVPRDDHEHYRIDGCLSGTTPRFPNRNMSTSNFIWGDTSHERWASAYHGQTLSANSGTTATAHSTIQRGVQGWHSDQVLPYTDGLQDVYPLGHRGYNAEDNAGRNLALIDDHNAPMTRMYPLIQWYSNPVHIANVRWNDMVARSQGIGMYGMQVTSGNDILTQAYPDLECAVGSPRTVPSGKFLPVGGIPALTRSLGSLVGFDSGAKKLGQLAETKTVKEAVIVMPYVEKLGRRMFVQLDKAQIDRYYGRGEFSDTAYWASLEDARNLEGTSTSPESGLQVNLGPSILRQIRLMKDYVIPPHLDFTKEASANPYAMYIFEYEHQFSAQDLSDMWQGLFPDSGKIMKQVSKQVTHKLNLVELLGGTIQDGDKVPNQIRFMVFKVKQRAAINYFDKTADNLDDARFKFKFQAGAMKKSTDYSYNWPYDFFSLVETAKIDMSVTLRNKRLVESIELQELNERFTIPTLDPVPSVLAGYDMRGDVTVVSISEESVRSGRRSATADAAAAAVTATYGPPGGSRL